MTLFVILTLTAVISYLCGCVNGAIVTSKYVFRRDIRKYGSGNPGLTNFCRVFGKRGVALLLIIDAVKAAVPVYLAGIVFKNMNVDIEGVRACALFFVMLGHSFPIYHRFKGGKTVLCAGVGMWFIDWRVALVCWAVFAMIFLLTHLVSLGSIGAGMAYPFVAACLGTCSENWMYIFMFASAALLVIRHRGNIQRLLDGTEKRMYIIKEQ
ncbi:MAG: glycerol-3-phosphate acyltransferase [Oscillospiraceae bacterium]|nr:glycerol-3-phosphate acyltransferase [Oscillospiraceae bacterium]